MLFFFSKISTALKMDIHASPVSTAVGAQMKNFTYQKSHTRHTVSAAAQSLFFFEV
jgi:hypothetical protein